MSNPICSFLYNSIMVIMIIIIIIIYYYYYYDYEYYCNNINIYQLLYISTWTFLHLK